MATINPYQAPTATVGDQEEYGEVRVLSSAGRIGRVRYIGYSIGLFFLAVLIGGVLGAIVGAAGMVTLARPLGLLVGLSVFGIQVMLTVQRCHDCDMNGWCSLLMIFPLLNFIFCLVPGTDGPNRYGLRPPPNSTGVVVLALVLPLFVIGIMTAVSIPAYKHYQDRARAAQQR